MKEDTIMPNFIIAVVPSELPQIYLSQQPYHETLAAMKKCGYSSTHHLWMYEFTPLPRVERIDPEKCHHLTLRARVAPENVCENYRHLLSDAIENLPLMQVEEEITKVNDLLSKVKLRVEQREKLQTQQEVTSTSRREEE